MKTIIVFALLGAVDYSAGRSDVAVVAYVDYAAGRDVPEPPRPMVPARPTSQPAGVRQHSAGYYPVHANRWNVLGDWNPSRAKLIAHLQEHSNHAGKFDLGWLNTLSVEQLKSLHSDDHDGRVRTAYLPPPQSQSPKAEKSAGREAYGTRDGRPAGPVGSTIHWVFGDPRYRSSSSCPNGKCPR